MVVIVSITTVRRGAEQTVALRKGERPFIDRDSSVCYADARLVGARELDVRVKAKSTLHVRSRLLKALGQASWLPNLRRKKCNVSIRNGSENRNEQLPESSLNSGHAKS